MQDPVVQFAIFFALAIFSVCSALLLINTWRVWRTNSRIGVTLRKRGFSELSAYEQRAELEKVVGSDGLAQALGHYLEELIPTRSASQLSSSVSAKHALASVHSVHNWICADLVKHCPGILTGTGIIGTFFGIYSGLGIMQKKMAEMGAVKDSEQQMELMTQAVNGLFSKVSPAFLASMICVLAAVIFTLLEKLVAKSVHSHVVRIAAKLDKIFPLLQSEQVLLDIQSTSAQTATDLRSAFTDIVASAIENSLKDLVAHGERQTKLLAEAVSRSFQMETQKLLDAQAGMPASISAAIGQSLEPMSDSLNQAVQQIKSESSNSAGRMITDMTDKFQDALANSASSQMKDLAKTLEGSANLMAGQQDAMSSFVSTMKDQMRAQNEVVESSLRQSREQQNAQLDEVRKVLQAITTETTQASRNSLTEVSTSITDLLSRSLEIQATSEAKIRDSIDSSSSHLSKQMSEFRRDVSLQVEQLTTTVEEVNGRLKESATSLIQDLASGTKESMAKTAGELSDATTSAVTMLSQKVEDSLARMESTTSALLASTGKNQQQLIDELTRVSRQLSEASSQSNDSSALVVERTRQTVESLNHMAGTLHRVVAEFTPLTGRFNDVGEKLSTASANIRVYGEQANQQNDRSNAIIQQLTDLHGQIREQVGLGESRLQGLQQATAALRGTIQAMESTNQGLGTAVTKMGDTSVQVFDSINSRAEEHERNVTQALKGYLKTFDESFNIACNGLQSITEGLTNSLEDFKDDLKDLTKR